MMDIHHRVGIDAPIEEVHAALATTEGVRAWWTDDARGSAAQGGELEFFFGRPDPSAIVSVTEVSPTRVQWLVTAGPDEWLATTITFDLSVNGDETVVLFSHAGWREFVPFEAHCSTKWAYFLLGLKSLLETGKGTPYPGELQISSWG